MTTERNMNPTLVQRLWSHASRTSNPEISELLADAARALSVNTESPKITEVPEVTDEDVVVAAFLESIRDHVSYLRGEASLLADHLDRLLSRCKAVKIRSDQRDLLIAKLRAANKHGEAVIESMVPLAAMPGLDNPPDSEPQRKDTC